MIQYVNTFTRTFLFLLSGLVLFSCESEADNLGSQFFVEGLINGKQESYDLVTYNIDNGDKIQSDASHLVKATLGAFYEPIFGGQKSSYVTQVRLTDYNPVFGDNPTVDSVVLVLKPLYVSDSAKVTTDENYLYSSDKIPAKKTIKKYPVSKYGRSAPMTINVHEVTDFLGSVNDTVYSDKRVNVGEQLGSYHFDGWVSEVKITKDKDNKELFSQKAGIRISLNADFFKNKIINKEKSQELSDASNFIRYFKGIRISIHENNGYILQYNPNDIEMIMYYKRDIKVGDKVTPTQRTFVFSMEKPNVHFNQIEYQRANSSVANLNIDNKKGDARLYAQGMGGFGFGVRIPAETIEKLQRLYKNEKTAILSAKIRVYTDESLWNNNYKKPDVFTVLEKGSDKFLKDVSAILGSSADSMVKPYDITKNPAYYDINITETFKNIIEKDAEHKDFILNIGSFEIDPDSKTKELLGVKFTTTPYTPHRVVLVGSDLSNDKRIKLNIVYTKK